MKTRAMAREVTVDASGKATGVTYVDKATGKEHHAAARVVVLAASACETVRILPEPQGSALFPNAASATRAASSESTSWTPWGRGWGGNIPSSEDLPPHNEDGAGGDHVYTPVVALQGAARGKTRLSPWLPRRVHLTGRQSAAGLRQLRQRFGRRRTSYGAKLKEEARRHFGSYVTFTGRGEMIPNVDSFCEIDFPSVRNVKWGILVLRFNWKWSEHETRQVAHMQRTFADWIAAMGMRQQEVLPDSNGLKAIEPGGSIIHEDRGHDHGGGARRLRHEFMVADLEDVKNVFVADGGVFASRALTRT